MKKFFSALGVIFAIIISGFGIYALVNRLRNKKTDVLYFDCPDDEKEEEE